MKHINISAIEIGGIYWYYESSDTTRYVSPVKVLDICKDSIIFEDVTPCLIYTLNGENGKCRIDTSIDVFNIDNEYAGGWIGVHHYYELYELTEDELLHKVVLETI